MPASRKRKAEDQLDPESTAEEADASADAAMQQKDSSDPLTRPGWTKRSAEKDPEDGFQKAEEAKE